jgi:hypothetical protein
MKAKELDDRCVVVGGDFFSSVPQGGDGYMIKGVIFNWDDERAAKILANCREALTERPRAPYRPGDAARKRAIAGQAGYGNALGAVAALTRTRVVWFGSLLVGVIGAGLFLLTIL